MKKNKIYGYMIGYRELGSRFVRYYTTFTHKSALSCLYAYRKSPPRERETNRPLIDPVWEIQPITKKEILRSILDEIPFLWEYPFSFFRCGEFRTVQNQKSTRKNSWFIHNILLSSTIFSFFVDFRQTFQLVHGMPILNCALSPLPKKAKIKKYRRKELCIKKIPTS